MDPRNSHGNCPTCACSLSGEAPSPEPVFYLVWAPERGVPKMKHDTYEIATQEAMRVASKEGVKTYVLKAMGGFKPTYSRVTHPIALIPSHPVAEYLEAHANRR